MSKEDKKIIGKTLLGITTYQDNDGVISQTIDNLLPTTDCKSIFILDENQLNYYIRNGREINVDSNSFIKVNESTLELHRNFKLAEEPVEKILPTTKSFELVMEEFLTKVKALKVKTRSQLCLKTLS